MSVYSDLDAQYPQTITGNSQWHILHLKDQHGCCLFSHCTVSGLTAGSRLFHYLSGTSYIRGWWRQLHIAMATEPAVLRHIWAEEGKYMRVYMWRNKVCEHFKGGYRQTNDPTKRSNHRWTSDSTGKWHSSSILQNSPCTRPEHCLQHSLSTQVHHHNLLLLLHHRQNLLYVLFNVHTDSWQYVGSYIVWDGHIQERILDFTVEDDRQKHFSNVVLYQITIPQLFWRVLL